MKYDYLKNITNDVKSYISRNNIDSKDFAYRDELVEFLDNKLWTEDSVTGYGRGIYTHSVEEAKNNLIGNEALLIEAITAFGFKKEDLENKEADAYDTIIRYYLLPEAINRAIAELEQENALSFDFAIDDEEL